MIVNWRQFEAYCEQHHLEARPHGRADKPDEHYPKTIGSAEPENIKLIENGNRGYFERMCKAQGLDPANQKISPALRAILKEQAERAARIDAGEQT